MLCRTLCHYGLYVESRMPVSILRKLSGADISHILVSRLTNQLIRLKLWLPTRNGPLILVRFLKHSGIVFGHYMRSIVTNGGCLLSLQSHVAPSLVPQSTTRAAPSWRPIRHSASRGGSITFSTGSACDLPPSLPRGVFAAAARVRALLRIVIVGEAEGAVAPRLIARSLRWLCRLARNETALRLVT